MRTLSTESRTSRIGRITLDAKQTGERKAGNPPIAFDVAGTGNVAWSRCCDTSQPKGRGNREHKLRPKPARQSPTLPRQLSATTRLMQRSERIASRPWEPSGVRQDGHDASVASKALALFRSRVSKPSVNQP